MDSRVLLRWFFGSVLAASLAMLVSAGGGCSGGDAPQQPPNVNDWMKAHKEQGQDGSQQPPKPVATADPPAKMQMVPSSPFPPAPMKPDPMLPPPMQVTAAPPDPIPPTQPAPPVARDDLFAGWPKPVVALVLSGDQDGYLEPCGCAGLENMKGGLTRRHTFIKELLARGWPVVGLDAGGQLHRAGKEAELQFQTTIESLRAMGYHATTFGASDLRLPAVELLAQTSGENGGKTLFTSANVGLFDFDDKRTPPLRIIEQNGVKIGVTAVLCDKAQKEAVGEGLVFKPAAEALRGVLPKLMEKKCDWLVLLSHGTPDEALELARKFPQFDLVVTSGGAAEPPADARSIEGLKTKLIEVGHKGTHVIVVGLYSGGETPLRYQRVPMDSRFAESPEMKQFKATMQDQLRELGFDGLGLKPILHPSGNSFVGSQTCGDCHTKAYDIWQKTPHAHALDTLVKLDPPRHFDPECASCHATGWEPQKFFPFTGGFLGLEKNKTPKLAQNGCENCHGPGSAHVAVESGDKATTPDEAKRLREQLRLPLARAEENCRQCHDLDNSPKFNFESFWPQVKHQGKD